MSKFFLYPISRVTRVAGVSLLTGLSHFGQFLQELLGQTPPRTDMLRRANRYRATAVSQPNRQRRNKGLPYRSRARRIGVRPYLGLIGLGLAVVFVSLMVSLGSTLNPVNAASPISIGLPLSTRGSQIVDSTGRAVFLRGVNWFGIETALHAPDGLSSRDYKEMLAQIKNLGYNFIRLPYSVESLRSSTVNGINFQLGSNQELQGKSPLEVMDAIIQEANRQGLLILLDSHRLNDQRIPELWYGDGFTEADWIDTWQMLATRYKNQANVMGADLKNEPHGRASWGTNDQSTDWRLAAERAGNAILEINPKWLIVVEGVEKNVPGQKLAYHWMGANLEGVDRFPVRLSKPNKLVYSPHEYGPGVYNQPWFNESQFPKNLESRWETGWHYIATKGIAPILIGEFGGRQVDANSKEGIWQRKLVDYIRQKDMSFAYWSWNPNSADTGGILQDDWRTVNADKQQLLQGLLLANGFAPATTNSPPIVPTPTPQASSHPSSNTQASSHPVTASPSPSSGSSSHTSTTSQSGLKLVSNIQSDWQAGFCMNIQVINPGTTPVRDWQVTFQMNQASINNSWNGNFQPKGSHYIVTPLDWGRVIEPGQTRDLGFCANKLGADYQPQQFSISLR
ncbi:MAG TPA: cellulase family glycosylhydrolase [Allocoleopsis sp.]